MTGIRIRISVWMASSKKMTVVERVGWLCKEANRSSYSKRHGFEEEIAGSVEKSYADRGDQARQATV